MKRNIVRWIAVMLVAMLMLTAAGCSGTPAPQDPTTSPDQTQQPSDETQTPDEPTDPDFSETMTLDVFNMSTTFAGEQAGWFGKLLKDRWNLILNIIPNDGDGDAKFQTLAASQNMGDVVIFGSPGQNFQQAMKAGTLLYDLSKDNAIYDYMPYFVEHFPVAVERIKSFSDDGGMYGIPTRVSMMEPTGSQNASEVDYGIMIRYDYYLGAGAPELNTYEDLLACFEAMKAKYPETEEGKKTYAASLHSGMDNAAGMAHAQTVLGLYGYAAIASDAVIYVDSMAENYQDILQEDGEYFRALHFFYELNQRGLLDPDSLTQTSSDASAKFGAGQVFYSNWYWEAKNAFNKPENVANSIGYEMAPLKDQKISSVGFAPGGTNGQVIALGAKCKDVARALTFFDWAYTSEGTMTLYNGPQGLTWEYDDNGMPYLTDFGKQALPQNNVDVPEEWGGMGFSDGFQSLSLYPMSNAEIDPNFGEAYKYANWSSTLADAMSNLDKLWCENMDGARYTKEYLVNNDMLSVIPGNTYTAPAMDTDMKATRDQVGNILKQYSWQMVFAKNEAEYESIKQEMITMATEMGYDTLVEYYLSLLPEVHQARVDAVNSVK